MTAEVRAGFSTPEPSYVPEPLPVKLIERQGYMDQHEKARISAAAHRAKRLYPGAVGELIARELTAAYEFGLRTDQSGLVQRLVRQIQTAPLQVP